MGIKYVGGHWIRDSEIISEDENMRTLFCKEFGMGFVVRVTVVRACMSSQTPHQHEPKAKHNAARRRHRRWQTAKPAAPFKFQNLTRLLLSKQNQLPQSSIWIVETCKAAPGLLKLRIIIMCKRGNSCFFSLVTPFIVQHRSLRAPSNRLQV